MTFSLVDALGFSAAFCTTLAFVPQAIKVLKTRDTQSLSLAMYSIFTFGVALWLAYGIVKEDKAMIVANMVTIFLASSILITKIYNAGRDKVENASAAVVRNRLEGETESGA